MASLGSSFKMAAKAKDIKAAGVNQREMFEALFDDSFQAGIFDWEILFILIKLSVILLNKILTDSILGAKLKIIV